MHAVANSLQNCWDPRVRVGCGLSRGSKKIGMYLGCVRGNDRGLVFACVRQVSCDPCKDFKAAKMAEAAAAASKAPIKVGGVPEHFNLPWKLATEQDLWTKHNAPAVDFLEVKGGTGAMIRGLRDKEYEPKNTDADALRTRTER